MNRLSIMQETTANIYTIRNDTEDIIGFITRRRCGQFMQYGLEISLALMEECVRLKQDLMFFPGCLDEIREKCRELKSEELKKCRKGKENVK